MRIDVRVQCAAGGVAEVKIGGKYLVTFCEKVKYCGMLTFCFATHFLLFVCFEWSCSPPVPEYALAGHASFDSLLSRELA